MIKKIPSEVVEEMSFSITKDIAAGQKRRKERMCAYDRLTNGNY